VSVADLTLAEVARAVRAGEVSPVEVVEAVLDRAARVQGRLRPFLWLDPERARDQARRRAQEPPRGPLHGVPVTLKDLIAEQGCPFTCGSGMRAHVVAQDDAEVTRRLREAGAVFVGRAHLHEFAFGVSNENPHFGPACNPWDPERSPGGSSGGSAVAVSTGCAFGSVGTDTGGSVRIPAALCGVVGLKPTYERVPRAGVFPLAPSLDHVGPLARTVQDVALLLEVLAASPGRYTSALGSGVRGLRLGVPRGGYWEVVHPEVAVRFEEAVRDLEREGARRVPVDFPWEAASAVATALLLVEAASVHAHTLRSRPDGYGADVRERLLVGLCLPAERYVQALRVRRALASECRRLWERVDLLATPAVPVPAPRLGELTTEVAGGRYDTRSLLTRFTNPFNALGLPAASVPCGFAGRLPVGLQLVGPAWEEARVLAAAAAFERVRGPSPQPEV
jgi:aspartyl-tRNA(Asn)/glutamyl-tRNA(Gln) amidotransferase subunit A